MTKLQERILQVTLEIVEEFTLCETQRPIEEDDPTEEFEKIIENEQD